MGTRIYLVLVLFAALAGAQSRSFPIDSIAVEGNRILSAQAIVEAAGLKPGDPGDAAAFDAARDRLIASGYFETVGYRYKPAGAKGYQITFEVKESATLYPLRVEALPVTAQQVATKLKAVDPLFTGRMPGTKQAIDRVAHEIEQMLDGKQEVAGRVIATAPDEFEIQFLPRRGVPAVATVTFEGSKAISPIDLRNKIAEVAFGQPFTDSGFRVFLDNQVRPAFEAKGYMRVQFTGIATTPSTQFQGLDVKVTVEDGPQYALSGVTVKGGPEGETAHILKLAKLPKMTIADFDQIRDGAGRIREGMHHDGYLDVDVTVDKKIYDADRTVEAFLVVNEGPRYTFRKLTVNGLGLDGEAAIRRMWSVKPGDSYPQEYPNYFVSEVKKEGLFDNLGDIRATPDIDRKTHIVDVTLDFKTADLAPKLPRRPGLPPI
jgi:outer membrane protein assembly factor BamA